MRTRVNRTRRVLFPSDGYCFCVDDFFLSRAVYRYNRLRKGCDASYDARAFFFSSLALYGIFFRGFFFYVSIVGRETRFIGYKIIGDDGRRVAQRFSRCWK